MVGLLRHPLSFVEFCFNVCYLLQLLFFTALHFLNLSNWFPPMIIDTKLILKQVCKIRLSHIFSTKIIGFEYKVKCIIEPIYKYLINVGVVGIVSLGIFEEVAEASFCEVFWALLLDTLEVEVDLVRECEALSEDNVRAWDPLVVLAITPALLLT